MNWVYLSPHFDDVALSCGGLVWEQVRQGNRVEIWTICGGEPPDGPLSPLAQMLHDRWQTGASAVACRQAEDIASCKVLGAFYKHIDNPDCIYRHSLLSGEPIVNENDEIMGWLKPSEAPLAVRLARSLVEALPPKCHLVVPLALGGHMDHRLTRLIAESRLMHTGVESIRYYVDYPYTLYQPFDPSILKGERWTKTVNPISSEALQAWDLSIAAHTSQISTFWDTLTEMEAAIAHYAEENDGTVLWQRENAK